VRSTSRSASHRVPRVRPTCLPVTVEEVETAIEVDAGKDDRGVGTEPGLGPLSGSPRRVLPHVKAGAEPFEVLVTRLDVTRQQARHRPLARAVEPGHRGR
jgi:hypothetical protein